MPNRWTFHMKPLTDMIERKLCPGVWVDPFVGKSPFAHRCQMTNDLNPDVAATHHMDSLEFLKQIETYSVDGVLFDPPYSPRQITESYAAVGIKAHMQDTQTSFYGLRKNEIGRITKVGALAICCGWNSTGIGKKNGFELEEVLILCHGSAHNDTIITVERKVRDIRPVVGFFA